MLLSMPGKLPEGVYPDILPEGGDAVFAFDAPLPKRVKSAESEPLGSANEFGEAIAYYIPRDVTFLP